MPATPLPTIPPGPLKNLDRTQRILAAYQQLQQQYQAEAEAGEGAREPSREEVGRLVGASMRDVQPVLSVHKALAPWRAEFDQLPEILTWQVLASLNQQFEQLHQTYAQQVSAAEQVFETGVAELGSELQALEQQLEAKTFELLNARSEQAALAESLAASQAKVEQWHTQHQELTEHHRTAVTEAREAQTQIQQLQADLARQRQSHRDALEKAEAEFKAMRAALVAQHEAANAQLMMQLAHERQERKTEQKKKDTQFANQDQALQQLQAQRHELQAELRHCRHELSTAQTQREVAQQQLKALRGELEQAQSEVAELTVVRRTLEANQASSEAVQQQLAQLQAAMVEMRGQWQAKP